MMMMTMTMLMRVDGRADELNGQPELVGCIWCNRASLFVWIEI